MSLYRNHVWSPDPNAKDEPVDLTPYLNNSPLHKVATVLYRGIFQPIENLLERMSRARTIRLFRRAGYTDVT